VSAHSGSQHGGSQHIGSDGGLHDQQHPVEIVRSETVFRGHVWDVRQDTFLYGGDEVTREFVAHTGAVAVLALDEKERVLLIRQYRHPIGERDWEIPAGLLDIAGEDALGAAQRELAEEVDLQAVDWHILSDIRTSPGGNSEIVRIYLARGVSATAEAFARTEEEVDIEKRWVSLDEAVDAFLARDIQNSILGNAVLAAYVSRAKGWATLGPAVAPLPPRALPTRD